MILDHVTNQGMCVCCSISSAKDLKLSSEKREWRTKH